MNHRQITEKRWFSLIFPRDPSRKIIENHWFSLIFPRDPSRKITEKTLIFLDFSKGSIHHEKSPKNADFPWFFRGIHHEKSSKNNDFPWFFYLKNHWFSKGSITKNHKNPKNFACARLRRAQPLGRAWGRLAHFTNFELENLKKKKKKI